MLPKAIGPVPGLKWKFGASIYVGCCAILRKIGSEDFEKLRGRKKEYSMLSYCSRISPSWRGRGLARHTHDLPSLSSHQECPVSSLNY